VKPVSVAVPCILLLLVLGLGMHGIGRSLWLDEAWVANSIREPALHGMFFYSGWLQVNPPLFLLLARSAAGLLGASNAAFRAAPLLLALAAAAGMFAVSRRLLAAPWAALATAIVVFDPTAIEYSRMLKPYSGELAASVILLLAAVRYLQQPDGRRFGWLLATVAMALPLAYSTVFLLPGIVLAVAFMGGWQRGVCLGGLAAAVLLALYGVLIRFNLAPELHAFWAAASDKMTAGVAAALLFCLVAAIRAVLIFRRREPSSRDWAYLVCLLPCLLLAVGGAAGWYPVSHRTRLFVLPCFILLAMMTLVDVLGPWATGAAASITACALSFGLAVFAIADQRIGARETYEEDFDGAVSFLTSHVAASDLILVHACCKEGFLLYSGMDHWATTPNRPRVVFGDTGWPCCARGKDARPGASSERAAIQDLDSKIPPGYSGRVWLLYTTRPTHWSYTGLDEGDLWRRHLWDRGCPPGPYLRFANLAVSPMNCAEAR
jgi:Dolichyl-phosphate-mannose-protein mannosyltransferase